jgi:hypothetical protein
MNIKKFRGYVCTKLVFYLKYSPIFDFKLFHMAEVNQGAQTQNQAQNGGTQPQAGKGLKMGKPLPALISDISIDPTLIDAANNLPSPNTPDSSAGASQSGTTTGTNGAAATQPPNGATNQPTGGQDKPKSQPTDLPGDDQVRKYLEAKGIKFDPNLSIEEQIKKLSQPATTPPPELTPEQKAKAEEALEQRILNSYIQSGGKVEDYVALKQITAVNLKDFSLAETKRELKKEGFTDDQIEQVIKERYYQFSDEEIEEYENEDEKNYAKKKRDFGSKKLEKKYAYVKTQAESVLKNLREAVLSQDAEVEQEKKFSSMVDEHSKKLPRKLTFQLGEVNGQALAPVDYDVEDSEINEVVETLKNPEKRQQFFYNTEGDLNLANVAEVMLRNKVLERAIVAAYQTGSTRAVEEVRKTFGGDPHSVGLTNGAGIASSTSTGKKGKLVSAGKPQVAVPQQK